MHQCHSSTLQLELLQVETLGTTTEFSPVVPHPGLAGPGRAGPGQAGPLHRVTRYISGVFTQNTSSDTQTDCVFLDFSLICVFLVQNWTLSPLSALNNHFKMIYDCTDARG